MKKYSLSAQPRTLVGRKVKKLREQGQIPATLYGKKIKSENLAVKQEEFQKVFAEAGETGLVELKITAEKSAGRQVLVHHLQRDPVSDKLLHVEFFQVDLKEKVHTKVPLVFMGQSPAVAQKTGVMLTLLDEVEVEALPADLPEKLSVDTSILAEVNQELKVSDLKVSAGVTVLTDQGQTMVKIGPLITKKAEAEVAAAAVAAAAAVPTPPEGGEAPAAGEGEEKPAESKTPLPPVPPEAKPEK